MAYYKNEAIKQLNKQQNKEITMQVLLASFIRGIFIGMLLVAILIMLGGCGSAKFEPLNYQCRIQGDLIVCPDGSTAMLPEDGQDGTDGIDGVDGINGLPGTDGAPGFVTGVVEPCPDITMPHPEVLLTLATGQVMAWYMDRGFVILQEGVNYQTTDGKSCIFTILNGEVISL